MRRVSEAMEQIAGQIAGKDVLEVACGCGEFSIAAAPYARSVRCVDLDGGRLLPEVRQLKNAAFSVMDAANLQFDAGSADEAVFYNALAHVEYALEAILRECRRVLRRQGQILFISSFKMDRLVMENRLLPLLTAQRADFELRHTKNFAILRVAVSGGGACVRRPETAP